MKKSIRLKCGNHASFTSSQMFRDDLRFTFLIFLTSWWLRNDFDHLWQKFWRNLKLENLLQKQQEFLMELFTKRRNRGFGVLWRKYSQTMTLMKKTNSHKNLKVITSCPFFLNRHATRFSNLFAKSQSHHSSLQNASIIYYKIDMVWLL